MQVVTKLPTSIPTPLLQTKCRWSVQEQQERKCHEIAQPISKAVQWPITRLQDGSALPQPGEFVESSWHRWSQLRSHLRQHQSIVHYIWSVPLAWSHPWWLFLPMSEAVSHCAHIWSTYVRLIARRNAKKMNQVIWVITWIKHTKCYRKLQELQISSISLLDLSWIVSFV